MGKGKAWNEDEIVLIEKYVNTMTLKMIESRLSELNRERGIKRSEMAIKLRLIRMGYSVKPTENWMCCRLWAVSLGITHGRVLRWIKDYGLHSEPYGIQFHVSRQSMCAFASRKPQQFASIAEDILAYYFGDDLTEFILSKREECPVLKRKPKKIKRMDTGDIYPSLTVASKYLGMSRNSIRVEAQRNGWLRFV
jgi:hypothetical protein